MTRRTHPPRPGAFSTVPVRPRTDGWTAERQTGFIEALARTANVEAAARAVGMGTSSAYELRARADAASFREAWGVALDYAVHRLGEAVLDRAINGVATPVFFQGEQIGERRRYDERLSTFLLRIRDPERYGRWREELTPMRHPDGAAMLLSAAIGRVATDASGLEEGFAPPPREPLPGLTLFNDVQMATLGEHRAQRAEQELERRQQQRYLQELDDD